MHGLTCSHRMAEASYCDEEYVSTAWDLLIDKEVELTADSIIKGFQCYGYESNKDLRAYIWYKDGLRDHMETYTFKDYDTAFRAWAAFHYCLAEYAGVAQYKCSWNYHCPTGYELDYIYPDLSLKDRRRTFFDLEMPAMVSGFSRQAVESGNVEELSSLFSNMISIDCADKSDDMAHVESNGLKCDCLETSRTRELFLAQGSKYPGCAVLQKFLASIMM